MYIGPKIVTDQLVFCTDADSVFLNPGVEDAYDNVSGSLNTDSGANWSRVPDGYDFVGVAPMQFAHNPDWELGSLFTLEAFFRPTTGTQDNYAGLIAKDSSGSFGSGVMCMAQTAGYIRFGFNSGAGNSEISNPSYTDMETSGVWFHYVGTYDGATMNLYRDGVLIATDNFTGQGQGQTEALSIGGRTVGNQYSFEGRIKFARIYKKALSLEEVQHNYKHALTRI